MYTESNLLVELEFIQDAAELGHLLVDLLLSTKYVQ